jgi:hypothetical protein
VDVGPPRRQLPQVLPAQPWPLVSSAQAFLAVTRKKRETGKLVVASLAEKKSEVVAMAKRLRRASPKTGEQMSYLQITARLEDAGYVNDAGVRYNPKSIKATLDIELRERREGRGD